MQNDNEVMYVKCVKTSELQRVFEWIENEDIGKVTATRSYSKNINRMPIPHLPYITVNELRTNKLKIDYNSLIDGKLDKNEMINLLNSLDEKPLSVVIQELHIFCKNNGNIGDILAEETKKDAFRRKKYVAIFKNYPISREGEDNQFVQAIENFRTEREMGITAYKLHSLDFKYVIDLHKWREIVKLSKIHKDYNLSVKHWTKKLMLCQNKAIKAIVEDIFPKNVTYGRVYRRGSLKGKWILDKCGENI